MSLPHLAFYTTFFRMWVLTPSPLKFVMECSATLAFLWHETNYFGVSLFWYLHNSAAFYMTFFSVWVLTQSPLKFVMECSATLLLQGTDSCDLSTIGRACLLCGDSQYVSTPTPFSFFCALLSVRQQRGITDTFCVWKKKNLDRRTSSIIDSA